ncbi:MAG TPA: hypothetical protein VMS64_26765 [Candidatus Methylomirabilis sp.]|nr:hypothetical protein [Candidatus Methylomirabilis sp.]
MADTLVTALRRLAREKAGLRNRGQLVAKTERRLVDDLGRLLPTIGYRLVPLAATKQRGVMADGSRRVKRLQCPKCDRRFAHPLPLARHLSATHGIKKGAAKPGKKAVKKAS